MNSKQILTTFKKVFSNLKYSSLAIIIALLFYLFNVLISGWSSIRNFYPSFGFFGTLKFFVTLALGFNNTISSTSFITLIIISILFGILFSLIIFKIKLGNGSGGKKIGFFGGIGIFIAAFAPGCAACGIGLASILGISAGFLTFLPYKGLELSIIAIAILIYTVLKVTNDMYICKPTFNTNMKGGKEK